MDNSVIKTKVVSWLKPDEIVKGAKWSIEEDRTSNSVKVKVSIIKTITDKKSNKDIKTFKIVGSSVTENTEEAISGAVVALNNDLLNILGSDSKKTDDGRRLY